MRKSNKQPSANNSSTGGGRPELFNFFANKGKNISLILKNENVRVGQLVGICKNGTILLESVYPLGVTRSEVPLFDVSEILILDN